MATISRRAALLLLLVVVCLPCHAYIVPPRNVTFASLSTPTLLPRGTGYGPLPTATWTITGSCCGYGPFSEQSVANASNVYGLFDFPCGWPTMPQVMEWGYEFHHNQNNIFPVCGSLTMAGYPAPPTSRDDALGRLAAYWTCRVAAAKAAVNASAADPTFSMIGHYFYSGYSAGFGAGPVIPGSEIGENINSINAHFAFTRGAARQAGAPFIIDFSAWMGGFIRDYSTAQFWGAASSPHGGHSMSLFRRAYFATFMAGAAALIAEAGAVNYFYEAVNTSTGVFQLSPVGDIGADLYALSHPPLKDNTPATKTSAASPSATTPAETVRGIPYVPVALVVEEAMGMGVGWWYQGEAWDTFPLTPVEQRTSAWFEALWPQSFHVMDQENTAVSEAFYMVAGPLGDTVDVLQPHLLTATTLTEGYRLAILPGLAAPMSAALAATLEAFVAAGGALLLYADDAASLSQHDPAAGMLGFTVGSATTVDVVAVEDLETGWVNKAVAPFCVQSAAAGDFYIKTGGDPTQRTGWDGGIDDKCCSLDSGDCVWFGTAAACAAALAAGPLCRGCGDAAGGQPDVGCPAWPQAAVVAVWQATNISTAVPLLQSLAGRGATQTAMTNRYGSNGGLVTTLLSADPAMDVGFGVLRHILARIHSDISPISVTSNTSTAGGNASNGGLQVLLNKSPAGWNITIINNHGVVKATNAPEVVDPSQGRSVRLALTSNTHSSGTEAAVQIAAAWITDGTRGRGAPAALPIGSDGAVEFTVPAGSVALIGLSTVQT